MHWGSRLARSLATHRSSIRVQWRSRFPEKRGNCDDQSERVSCNDRGGRGGFQRGGASASEGAVGSKAATGGEKSARLFLPADGLKPATFDRLPLEWHKQRAQKLRENLAEDGYEGILLTDRWNIIYFTGLWHTTTERLVNVFLPLKGDPVWFNSALDRDLVKTWWYNDGEMYFDWFHAEGAFPNEGKVQMGAKVDLFEWLLKSLKNRGCAGQKLAADIEF